MTNLNKIIENIDTYLKEDNKDKKKLILEIQEYFKDCTQDKLNSENPKEIKKLIDCHSILMKPKRINTIDKAYLDYYINKIPKYHSYLEIERTKISNNDFNKLIKTILESNLLKTKQNRLELFAFVGCISLYSMELQDTTITNSEKDIIIKIDFNLKSKIHLLILGSKKYEDKINKIKKELDSIVTSFHPIGLIT